MHAGHPVGSTVNFGSKCQLAFLKGEDQTLFEEPSEITNEAGETVEGNKCITRWGDQSSNGRHAAQTTAENAPWKLTDGSGGIEFYHHSDNADYADYMSFTSFLVSTSHPFMSFIVCSCDPTTSCYLSQQGTEVLQYTSGNQHQLKTGITSNMTHSSTFTIGTGEKHLFVIERDASDNIYMYKNGLKYDPSTTNNGNWDVNYLGVKNNPGSQTNWFDGIMYDIVFIDNEQDDHKRKQITDYLLTKNGLERLGND